jgi:hypothetical protein
MRLSRALLLALLVLVPVAHAQFSTGSSGASGQNISPNVTINGITTSPSPMAGTTMDPQGTSVGSLTATTVTGQAAQNPVFTITNDGGTGYTIQGSSVVVGATPPGVGTYSLTIQVSASNMTNPVPFSQSGLQAAVTSTLSITGVNCPPASATAGGPQGTSVGACVATFAGGTPGGTT